VRHSVNHGGLMLYYLTPHSTSATPTLNNASHYWANTLLSN